MIIHSYRLGKEDMTNKTQSQQRIANNRQEIISDFERKDSVDEAHIYEVSEDGTDFILVKIDDLTTESINYVVEKHDLKIRNVQVITENEFRRSPDAMRVELWHKEAE